MHNFKVVRVDIRIEYIRVRTWFEVRIGLRLE
jgi:hypothetical protein